MSAITVHEHSVESGHVGEVDLTRLFHPRTLAVIGAHDSKAPFDFMFKQLAGRLENEGGTIYPINPKLETVFGYRTYASLDDVPGEVDVVVILVSDVLGSMEQVVRKRPAFTVVHASGFSEGGSAEGRAAEDRLRELARRAGTRLVGPNTNMNMFEVLPERDTPLFGLATQSGHQGRPLAAAQELGYGMSYWVTTGNEADLGLADFVAFMARQDDTKAIASYVEGFGSGAALRRAAAASIETGTPWVLVKVGTSDQGAAAAMSHTGKLAGSDAAMDAFFTQHGIHRVHDLDELLDVTSVLSRVPALPGADGVAIISASGGSNAHLVDVAVGAGLTVPELSRETQEKLRELLPKPLATRNPVDNGGYSLLKGLGSRIVDIVLDDPAVGILLLPVSTPLPAMGPPIEEMALHAHRRGDKPVITLSLLPSTDDPVYRAMVSGGVPVVRNMRNGVSAARALLNHPARRYPDVPPAVAPFVPVPPDAVRTVLSEERSLSWLAEHGLDPVRHVVVDAGDEAALETAGEAIGYPLVLKAVADGLVHKSERGAVEVGIADAGELRAARTTMLAGLSDLTVRAFLVAEQASGGVELLVGISQDPVLGPLVMVGSGGTEAEAVNDTAISVLPFDERRAREMVDSLRMRPLLGGWRGRPALDIGAVVRTLCTLGEIAARGEVAELDVNPLLVRPDGVVMLDAVVSVVGSTVAEGN
ncbi:acetate--CoA ligase family protein [Nocardia sp. NPDC050799]|uniref:acetate--CoA ligase family protein n=1 Tax=Nocardia sp. NPDC050799 TaxID=3154842 RepID=UPI0034010647